MVTFEYTNKEKLHLAVLLCEIDQSLRYDRYNTAYFRYMANFGDTEYKEYCLEMADELECGIERGETL